MAGLFIPAGTLAAVINTLLLCFPHDTRESDKYVFWDMAVLWGGLLALSFFLSEFYGYGQGPYRIGRYQGFTPIAPEYAPLMLAILLVPSVMLFMIRGDNGRTWPPLIKVVCVLSLVVVMVYSVVFIVQLHGAVMNTPPIRLRTRGFAIGMVMYPVNILLISIRVLYLYTLDELRWLETTQMARPVAQQSHKLLLLAKHGKLAFIVGIPLFVVLLVILAVTGQLPQVVSRPFTETSSWFLSQHQWERPGYLPGGHYLCTVAVAGDPRLLKPERIGLRHGQPIVVNRQLAVANAFEQVIMERLPRFHRWVRGVYDRHGYPLSRHITTVRRANVTYVVMKPLEWLFVLVLYTVDGEPERRIARQYGGL